MFALAFLTVVRAAAMGEWTKLISRPTAASAAVIAWCTDTDRRCRKVAELGDDDVGRLGLKSSGPTMMLTVWAMPSESYTAGSL
jgi:hypothetical protein